MCRTGMCRFGIGNWIFLVATLHLFTYAQGGDEPQDPGVRFTTEPSDVVVTAGSPALLACSAAARGVVRLTWRHSATAQPTREDTLQSTDKYRKQLTNGSLVIESVTAALAGQYQCVATVDGVGTIVSRVATIFLAELPEVTVGPRSILGIAGEPVLLPCGLRAPPRLALSVLAGAAVPDRRVYGAARLHHAPPTLRLNVTWLHNGSPVRLEAARVTALPSGALELEPARAHDAGKYRCRVALYHAPHVYTTSEEMELRVTTETSGVESPPRFIATPQPLTVMEGASVTFDCAAVGNPKPEMTWLNNGVAIDLSDLDSRFYLVGSGSLRVQSARALDAGAYTCRAHNRLDSADHSTQLTVLTAPRVQLSTGSVVRAVTRGDVTLRCEARARPAPAVAWLKDGEPLTPNDHDIALVDGTSLRIQGVLRVDAGMFQCMGSSAAGTAVAALRLIVLPPGDEAALNATKIDPKINPKSFPNPSKPPKNSFTNSTQDIFNSLISSGTPDQSLDHPDDLDFLGETSSAYTSGPDVEYDDLYPDISQDISRDQFDDISKDISDSEDISEDNSFHAAEGLDLDELRKGNTSVVSMPRALRAVIVKHRFVTLSWEEPEFKGEEITGYAVVYKVKGSERERVSRGAASRHEMNVPSLQPNTTYLFSVLAHTQHAVSPPTDPIEVQTPPEELTYGAPRDVAVTPQGPHSLLVTWNPPHALQPSIQPPSRYAIIYTESESGREQQQWVEATGAGAGAQVATLAGLRAASAYGVRVAAAGGAPSPALRTRTPSDAPAAPPANLTAVPTGATSILVRWEAPPSRTHRGPLTGYKVRYRAGPPGAPGGPRRKADSLTTPADARRAELRGLDTATTYQIRVCAINANGSGPFSEWVSATTQQQQMDETRVPPQPPPLTTRAGRDWISVWWSEDASSTDVLVRGYWLGWGLGVPDETSRELPPHLHSHVIRGLESNSEYVISLRASNALGLGPPVYATVRTRPAPAEGDLADDDDEDAEPDDDDDDEEEDDAPPLIPPVGLKVIMLSGTTAVVYWTDPTLPKGQTATDGRRYVVRYAAGGARARTFNATDLNCMLDDLRPFTAYEFAVKLIKGGRESSWSMLVTNTTLEAAPASAPRDLRVGPATNGARAADLAWAAPTKPNGIITGYVIMYAVQRSSSASTGSSPSTGDWTAIAVVGDNTRARVDRLRPRTSYSFKIQARNSKGLGPFSNVVSHTTSMETGDGGGLASATSAWLWASAGGACAVLALAAALALSLCCRRSQPPLSAGSSTYQKSSASAAIKPPDLWIHHDQMELKHLDKSFHSSASKISAGSVDGPSALMSSTQTLGRAPPAAPPAPADYEPARHHAPPASLDRRHYVPTYVESSRAPSCGSGSDDTAVCRASPSCQAAVCPSVCLRCDYRPMTGMGMGPGSVHNMVGMGSVSGMTSVSCASTCERRQHPRHHPDQSTPLLAGVAPLGSPQSSLASLQPPPAPCGSGSCPLGAACSAPGGPAGPPCGLAGPPGTGGDIYACAARERGHYVAYEPLGHYTHRDSLSSEPAGAAGGTLATHATGSLSRRAGPGVAPLHSFSDASEHSTPTHSNRSVRESSPYKKSASSSPGHLPNRLQLGGAVPHCSEELEPLTPSRSTERLHREMQNLEGLMKDLSAITQQQFHC